MDPSAENHPKRFRFMPLVIIGLIAVGIVMLISASKDMSTYSTFAQAKRLGDQTKVVGVLAKDKPMYYDAAENPNLFRFYMADQDGEVREITLHAPKPQDFELSEQVVVTGAFSGDEFIASTILMKCPSKYKNEEILVRSNM